MKTRKAFQLLALLLVVTIALTIVIDKGGPSSASTATTVFPHVQGTQLIDASGKPFLLRGAQIEGSFAYYNSWFHNNNVTRLLNPTVFNQMVQVWHMNAVRIPLSNWIWAADPTNFVNLLDQVVQEANQAGLYVVMDLHDDDQGGSPYGSGAGTPKAESIIFWKAIATHYASNPMIVFDAFNEPWYPDGNSWLNGGGTITGSKGKSFTIVGMQALVDAIRSTGAQQMIVIGGIKFALSYEKKYHVQLRINDPNIIYTKHTYSAIIGGNSTSWDALWGSFKGSYPLYFGEWAVLPNANLPLRCAGATMQNADSTVNAFLNYMQQNNMSWTAWQFNSTHLVMNRTNFAPTKLNDPSHSWTCNSPNANAGMGADVKAFLLSH